MAATTLIGVDIGSTAVRAVQTSRGKDGPVVTGFGQLPLPAGAVQGGVIQDDRAVTAALKELWAAAKFRGKDVVLGVASPQTVVRAMSVANLPARELRRSLPFQVRDVLPLPPERVLLDFCPLAEPAEDDTVRGLLIAAPKEAVLTAVRAVERAGLHVARVDLASFALLRAVARLDDAVEAIVDIGAQGTTVVVHADGEPLIVRTVPRGGDEVTEQIAARLGVAQAEAEALKCRVGLRGGAGSQTAEVIEEAVRPLIGEIRGSFAYLTGAERQTQVRRLLLAGGGAQLPGLVEALGAQLGVDDVTLADPALRLRHTRGRPELPGAGGLTRIGLSRAGLQGQPDAAPDPDDQLRTAAVSIGLTLGAA